MKQLTIFDQPIQQPIKQPFPAPNQPAPQSKYVTRVKIPHDAIRLFISSQVERLNQLYSHVEFPLTTPTKTQTIGKTIGKKSSVFHC